MKKIKPTIILVRPQLSENIGMAARAMDNFGLSKLSIINPRDGWPSKKAENSAKHADKVINSANNNEESKKKISEVIVKVVEKNPEKAVEIIEKNKNTNAVLETVKTKIEKGEAVSADDFEEVFNKNVSPN